MDCDVRTRLILPPITITIEKSRSTPLLLECADSGSTVFVLCLDLEGGFVTTLSIDILIGVHHITKSKLLYRTS